MLNKLYCYCPYCKQHQHVIKKGFNKRGVQTYRCEICHHYFLDEYATKTINNELRAYVYDLKLQNKSLREISKIVGISHQTVANWLKTESNIQKASRDSWEANKDVYNQLKDM